MSYNILLVDDVHFFLELEANYLSMVDCEVYTASNGIEAIKVLREQKIDLVITDYEMPEMDGYSFICEKSRIENLKDIPVIVVSGYLTEELTDKFLKGGAKAVIKKPFNDLEFLKIVNSFLSKDRRIKERVVVQLPCFFGFGDIMERGIILDISEGGLFLSSSKLYKEGTFFEIKFIVPNEDKTVKLWGRVIWVNTGEERIKKRYPDGMGVEFSGMTKEQLQIIKSFIERVKNGYQA